jgi:glutathione S-transferase
MQLYDLERSGNCYKIRLFLSILGLEYDRVPVDDGAGELQSEAFLALNPNGLVPVLTDGATTIYDSAAILTWLALNRGGESWLPLDPLGLGSVIRWLTFEQAEGRYGLARARAQVLKLVTPLADSGTLPESLALADSALGTYEKQLTDNAWLAGGEPTIADIACYPYTALIPDAGISLENRPAIRRWMVAIENLPGYVPLPRVGS